MDNNTTERVTVTQTPSGNIQTQTTTRAMSSMSDFFVSKTNQVIFAFVAIVDLLLLLRVVFLILGANQVGVVSFILNLTQIFVAPFAGIFTSPSSGSAYLDVSAIVAMVMYLVFATILAMVVNMFSNKTE